MAAAQSVGYRPLELVLQLGPAHGLFQLTSTEEDPALNGLAGIEDLVAFRLTRVDTPEKVRPVVMDLLEDQRLWELYAQMPSTSSGELSEVVDSDESLFGDLAVDGIDDVNTLLRVSLVLFQRLANSRSLRRLVGTKQKPGTLYALVDNSNPMGFAETRIPTEYKKALLGLRASEICVFGLGAIGRYNYAPGVAEALVTLFIENHTRYVALEVGLLETFGDANWFGQNIVQPLDIAAIEASFEKTTAGYQRFVTDARASSAPVFPEPPGDATSFGS